MENVPWDPEALKDLLENKAVFTISELKWSLHKFKLAPEDKKGPFHAREGHFLAPPLRP